MPKPPCELCGNALYREAGVRRCRPCGGEHDLCVSCSVRHQLTSIEEMVKHPHGHLLVCPDSVRVVRALMGEDETFHLFGAWDWARKS